MLSLSSLFGEEARVLRETDFQVLLLATLLPVLGTSVLSPILDTLIGPFGATPANVGLLVSLFTAPAVVMIPVTGVLADRYGRKPVLVAALVLFGLAGTAIAFTTSFEVALALRFLQGVGFAGINPIIITSIGDLYTQERETTGQGLRFMFSGLSGATFPLVASALLLLSWQCPFLLYALALPVAVVAYVWFDEPTTPSRSVATDGRGRQSYAKALFRLVTHRRVFTVVTARGLMMTIWAGLVTYNSLIVVRLIGESPVAAGLLAAMAYLGLAIGASQAGRATSLLESRLALLVGANVFLGGGFVLVLFAPGIVAAVGGVLLSALGFGVLGALYRSIINDFAPTDLRAGLVSLSESAGRLCMTVTPFVMGAVIALASPTIGFDSALRAAGIGIAVLGSGGSIGCLLLASASGSVSVA